MQIGDLVRVIQTPVWVATSFIGSTGVIVAEDQYKPANQNSFSILLQGSLRVFGASYLEVVSESR